MPAHTQLFLKRINDLVRWYSESFWEQMDNQYNFERYEMSYGAYSPQLQQSGYLHLFAQNLIIFLIVLLGLVTLWLMLALKDILVSAVVCID